MLPPGDYEYLPGARVRYREEFAEQLDDVPQGTVQRTYRPRGGDWHYQVKFDDGSVGDCVGSVLEIGTL